MNVYDFDRTILDGDTEEYFFAYINRYKLMPSLKIKRMNRIIKKVVVDKAPFDPNMTKVYKIITKNIKNIPEIIEKFWDEHEHFIKPFYNEIRKDDDIISSATPAFLLAPIFDKLNLKNTIATEYNFNKYTFDNGFNYGEKKVINFRKKYGNVQIDSFYSDSDSDIPLAKCAKKTYKVTGDKIETWNI